jgi:hypothetical protein
MSRLIRAGKGRAQGGKPTPTSLVPVRSQEESSVSSSRTMTPSLPPDDIYSPIGQIGMRTISAPGSALAEYA